MPLDDAVYVHPQALCETDQIGPGTRIWAFAHVMAGAVLGSDCNVCDHVFIEGGARVGSRVTIKNAVLIWDSVSIEDDVFVGPGAVFTNDLTPRAHQKLAPVDFTPTRIRRGGTIGANATVVCGVTVGEHAFVAAGAVVTRDVADHSLVAGSPAGPIGWVCECGRRLPDELVCPCGRGYRLSDGGPGLEPAG